jgi:dihydrolipoamide dehydrogenase
MVERVDVAIVGAGSAGLAALREVRKATNAFIVVDAGPLGTTCARVGCMPSKALIQAANDIHGGNKARADIPATLASVRALRDRFAAGAAEPVKRLGARLVRGRARFIGPGVLRVGGREFLAKRVILATGSRPVVPEEFRALGDRVVTTDGLFELEDLPARIGVVGLGPVGLEIGQALSRLGCDVAAFDRSRSLGKLSDPAVNARAVRIFEREFTLRLGGAVTVRRRGGKVEVRSGGRACARDLILASLGRRPSLEALGLEALGVELDKDGLPEFDAGTMKVRGFPIYLAGDASVQRPVLHEAADDGRIAGYNSVHRRTRCFARRAPLSITFNDPNLAQVGAAWSDLRRGDFVTGESSFERQGRAVIMGANRGLLHVYAAKAGGRFLGAEMIGPAGEHLGHLMAWALQMRLTVFEMLRMPFYHPVVEEGLRDALRDAARKTESGPRKLEIAFCD